MTNLEKFIEIMNTTFDAKMKSENMRLECSPCGALKKRQYACKFFKCESCEKWWRKEWQPIAQKKKKESEKQHDD